MDNHRPNSPIHLRNLLRGISTVRYSVDEAERECGGLSCVDGNERRFVISEY